MKLLLAFICLMAVHILILANIQFTAWPEMFSYPYLLNNGFDLYEDIALPYVPGLILILSPIYKLFGYNITILQIITWSIILFSDLLIFFISQKILGKKLISLLPLALFIIIQSVAEGNMLWFDLATTPFILLAIFSLVQFNDWKKFFLAGLFLGAATLIKQQVGIVFAFLFFYLLWSKQWRDFLNLTKGASILVFLTLIYIFYHGIPSDFLFWTIEVPLFWYPQFPGYANFPTLRETLSTLLLFVPGVTIALLIFRRLANFEKVIFIIFIALFLSAFPRFAFFRLQPALAVYFVVLAVILRQHKINAIILPFSAALFILLSINVIIKDFQKPPRFYMPQDLVLAENLKKFTNFGDKIYLLGVSSQHYILTNTFPLKPWIDNYIWYMEIPGIQDKVVEGLDKEKIKYIFWKKPQSGQWFEIGTYQPPKVTAYIKTNYTKFDEINGEIEVWQRN